MRSDPQFKAPTPVRKRALSAREHAGELMRLLACDALQVRLDALVRLANVQLWNGGDVGVDDVSKREAGVRRGVLDRIEELTIGSWL